MLIRIIKNTPKIDFLAKRNIFYCISVFLLFTSVLSVGFKGLNFGIDFKGGVLLEIDFNKKINIEHVREELTKINMKNTSIQALDNTDNIYLLKLDLDSEKNQKNLINLIKSSFEGKLSENIDYRRAEFVGPTVSTELIKAGITAIVLAILAMLIYIWFRFELQFAVGAVVALIHDTILTIGLFSATSLEFNLATVAAILLIIGYSMNDTVIVYDRVRENLKKFRKMEIIQLLNKSINETLSRTINTTLTTILALLALYIFGGNIIKDFSFAMIWGILIGTYSSILLATPLLLFLKVKRNTNNGE